MNHEYALRSEEKKWPKGPDYPLHLDYCSFSEGGKSIIYQDRAPKQGKGGLTTGNQAGRRIIIKTSSPRISWLRKKKKDGFWNASRLTERFHFRTLKGEKEANKGV